MRLYRWLLRFYPARFREEYSLPMEQQFRDEYRGARRFSDKARLWLCAIGDLVCSLPAQLAREALSDLKHAMRVYRHRSSSLLFAITALGLAMGLTVGIFCVLNALLLRSLPFTDAGRLVELVAAPLSAGMGRTKFVEWRQHSSYLQDAAAFSSSEMNVTGIGPALRLKVAETSANFFRLLGTRATVGRTFARHEDVFGGDRVAVISYGLWQQAFAGVPNVAGKTLALNGMTLTIIGVAPAGFDYPGKTSLWAPTVFDFEQLPKHGAFLFQTIGRLKNDMSRRNAEAFFEADARRAAKASRMSLATDEQNRPRLVSLQNQLAGPVRKASWALSALALLLLLAACTNVAQLLLSRTTERQAELELRAALGASRGRLIQQLVTEALLITSCSACGGLLVAYWVCRVAAAAAPGSLAMQAYTVFDWRVVLFAATIAIATGLFFGLMPALIAGSLHPSTRTVRSGTVSRTLATRRMRALLIGLQAALTLTLLVSSLTMGGVFLRLLNVDLGFQQTNVVTLNVSLEGKQYTADRLWTYYRQALQKLRATQGVRAAGAVGYLPLANNIYMAESLRLDSGQQIDRSLVNAVTPQYFEAAGTRFLAGQDFRERGSESLRPVVIVNEAFARASRLQTRIVGRKIAAPWNATRLYPIIGVVQTARVGGPTDQGLPQVYWQIEEEPPPRLTFIASVDGSAATMLARCRDRIQAINPTVAIYDVKTMEQRLSENTARPRFYATATLTLATLALLLAAVGIYGVTAYSIEQQRRDIGIRVAVGATHRHLRHRLIQRSLQPLVVGVAAGVAMAFFVEGFLRSLTNAAASNAWTTYALATMLLVAAGLAAALASSRRVLRIDPAEALRSE